LPFSLVTYNINPGLSATFPWLSTQALGWESYSFKRLSFHFVSRQATSFVGSILMAPDYDASDSAPTSEAIAGAYADAVEGVYWRDFACHLKPLSMHKLGPTRYCRTSALGLSEDVKLYDVGNLYVCFIDTPVTNSGQIAGKLWVDYDIEFTTPQLGGGGAGSSGSVTELQSTAVVNQGSTSGFDVGLPLGTMLTNECGIEQITDHTLGFPAGDYLISQFFQAKADADEGSSIAGTYVGSVVDSLLNGTYSSVFSVPYNTPWQAETPLTAFIQSNGEAIWRTYLGPFTNTPVGGSAVRNLVTDGVQTIISRL
jgi:hypothetical protein